MRITAILVLMFAINLCIAQSLPIDFESAITTSNFIDFDGGVATVISNPQSTGINTSKNVAQIVRNGGQIWAGSKIELEANLDFTTLSAIKMKVFTTAPVGTIVKFKLEGNGQTERDVQTTVSGAWEELIWDFTGEPANFNSLVFMFDFGNTGDGSINSTFLFDDIQQLYRGIQIDLPVDFEGGTVNYTTTDFGGNASFLSADPTDPSNTVVRVIKTDQAATWAGTTIGTPGGFATNIPLSLSKSKMTVKVWSAAAGTPIRLKVEDSKDPTHTCETETNTTVSEDWEVMEFDFINQAPGTELLSIGLDRGWTYNMASIFFNFGTEGATAGEQTYYFDNVQFGDATLSTDNQDFYDLSFSPNPTQDQWTVRSQKNAIISIHLYDTMGRLISQQYPNSDEAYINASDLPIGIFLSKVSTASGTKIIRLIKE